MLILPLPPRPDWSRPPVVTLALMLACILIFVFGQGGDDEREAAAIKYYGSAGLPDTELPAYLADLRSRGRDVQAHKLETALKGGEGRLVLETMEFDRAFMQRLHADQVIKPSDQGYEAWRDARQRYEALRGKVFTERWSLKPGEPRAGSLLGHMFLHGDIMHLAGNMVVLFIVGYTVEAALGAWGFLALYLVGGLGAAVPDLLFAGDRVGYSLGASGAISAVMAAYLVLFGLRKIRFFYWLIFVFGTVSWPALAILPVWIGNELLQRFVLDPHGQVNYLAHFGGFVSGALLAGLYRWRKAGGTAQSVERMDADAATAQLRARAVELVSGLQFERAAQCYRQLVVRLPDDEGLLAEHLRVAGLARDAGLQREAAALVLKSASRLATTMDGAVLAQALTLAEAAPPRMSLGAWSRVAMRLLACEEFDAAEALALRLVSRDAAGEAAPKVLNGLVRALQEAGQPERAERARRLLKQRYPQLVTL